MIDEYWKSHPRPSKTPRKSAEPKSAKRSRKSIAREDLDENTTAEKKRARKSQGRDQEHMTEENGTRAIKKLKKNRSPNHRAVVSADDISIGTMSEYTGVADWDNIIKTVDTVERDSDGSLIIYFTL